MLCAEKLKIGCGEHHASAFEDSAFAEDIQHGAAHGVVGRIGERISIHAAEKEEESVSAVSDFMRIEVSFAEECRNVGFGKAFFPLRVENPGVAGKQPDFLMEKGPEKGEGLVERVAQAFGSHAATAGDVDFENRLPRGDERFPFRIAESHGFSGEGDSERGYRSARDRTVDMIEGRFECRIEGIHADAQTVFVEEPAVAALRNFTAASWAVQIYFIYI